MQTQPNFRPRYPAAEHEYNIRTAVLTRSRYLLHFRLSELLPDKHTRHIVDDSFRNEYFPFQFRIAFQHLPFFLAHEMPADMNHVGRSVIVYARIDASRHHSAHAAGGIIVFDRPANRIDVGRGIIGVFRRTNGDKHFRHQQMMREITVQTTKNIALKTFVISIQMPFKRRSRHVFKAHIKIIGKMHTFVAKAHQSR